MKAKNPTGNSRLNYLNATSINNSSLENIHYEESLNNDLCINGNFVNTICDESTKKTKHISMLPTCTNNLLRNSTFSRDSEIDNTFIPQDRDPLDNCDLLKSFRDKPNVQFESYNSIDKKTLSTLSARPTSYTAKKYTKKMSNFLIKDRNSSYTSPRKHLRNYHNGSLDLNETSNRRDIVKLVEKLSANQADHFYWKLEFSDKKNKDYTSVSPKKSNKEVVDIDKKCFSVRQDRKLKQNHLFCKSRVFAQRERNKNSENSIKDQSHTIYSTVHKPYFHNTKSKDNLSKTINDNELTGATIAGFLNKEKREAHLLRLKIETIEIKKIDNKMKSINKNNTENKGKNVLQDKNENQEKNQSVDTKQIQEKAQSLDKKQNQDKKENQGRGISSYSMYSLIEDPKLAAYSKFKKKR